MASKCNYYLNAAKMVIKLEKFSLGVTAAQLFNYADRSKNPMPCKRRGYIRTFPVVAATSWFIDYTESLNRGDA